MNMRLVPKYGVVLAGGGARGGAHIGVLKVLQEIGYPIELVVGASIGGMIGVMIGAGWTLPQIETFFYETDFGTFFSLDRTGKGLIDTHQFEAILQDRFGGIDVQELNPPVALMAADIQNFRRIIINKGPVVKAILATMAVPGLFPPVRWGDHLLVDGGIIENVPTQAAYHLGATRLIAIDIGQGLLKIEPDQKGSHSLNYQMERALYWLLSLANRKVAFGTMTTSIIYSYHLLVQYHLSLFPPDVLLRVVMPDIELFSIEMMHKAAEEGEAVARQHQSEIRSLIFPIRFRMPRRRYTSYLPQLAFVQGRPH
jgi:NTE family protein